MGTKNNPGKFDCYDDAHPDEPMFVLLGRDPAAGSLVRLWARRRELDLRTVRALAGGGHGTGRRPLRGSLPPVDMALC
jgi:hypothetical protein